MYNTLRKMPAPCLPGVVEVVLEALDLAEEEGIQAEG